MKTLSKVNLDFIESKIVEVERLSWFDALFSTIKSDLDVGKNRKAYKLTKLGQYLAQNFEHHSSEDLSALRNEWGDL